AALTLGAAALLTLPLAACGTDRSVVTTAPSSVEAPTLSGSHSILTPESTPIVVGGLVSGTACPNLSFTIATYLFTVNTSTRYTGGGCADIQPGARISFTGSRESETSTRFIVAELSFVTNSTPPTPTPTPVPVNAEGTITSIGSGMCPELQF